MYILSVISFLLLGGFLLLAAMRFGVLVAAAGCVGWCLSVCWVPTAILAFIYLLLVSNSDDDGECKPVWYMAEVEGFLDVYITYWACAL